MFPDNPRWALMGVTKCGQRAFMRPCQVHNCMDIPDDAVPLADLCAARNEMVFVVEDDDDLRDELIAHIKLLGYPVTGAKSSNDLKNVSLKLAAFYWISACQDRMDCRYRNGLIRLSLR